MTITVAPGVVNRIRRDPEFIVMQVQHASDPDAAAAALARAADDIAGLAADSAPGLAPGELFYPKWVSGVTRARTGPFLMIDAVDTPRRLLATIPDLVVARLEEAGVTDATVAIPRQGGPLSRMYYKEGPFSRTVSLVLYPRPNTLYEFMRGHRERIRDAWLVESAAWVGQDLDDDAELRAAIVTIEFTVSVGEALPMLRQAVAGDTMLDLVAGQGRQRRRAGIFPGREVAQSWLSAGGRAVGEDALVGIGRALIDVARRLAPEVAYATVSFNHGWGPVATDWYVNHGGEDIQYVAKLCDEYVIDAFAYQVLGPLHLARLGGPPPGAEPLAGDRVGLAVGELSDWLLAPPENPYNSTVNLCGRRRDPTVQDRGRGLLAPCLLRKGEGSPLVKARDRRSRGELPETGGQG